MIDEFNHDGTGWARFSDDKLRRYRLGRILDPRVKIDHSEHVATGYRFDTDPCDCPLRGGYAPRCISVRLSRHESADDWCNCRCHRSVGIVCFLLLNPSTADAWKPDQTVGKCVKFAQRWGAHVLEVVNLFAFRSPYPEDLEHAADLGIDEAADKEILTACRSAYRVIASWGNHGSYQGRDEHVRELLRTAKIPLMHLGLSKFGQPLHTMARGKLLIPMDREPVLWEAA